MQVDLQQLSLPAVISAVGGLGTAAFGLLEALKPVIPAINRIGFAGIERTVSSLTPPETAAGGATHPPRNALPQANILQSLNSNWVNGNDLDSQKAIAKSLIKLHLSPGNAATLAGVTNVDPTQLAAVAEGIASGTPLTQPQGDAWSRFDLIVTAMLDECYQRADQIYRNWTRGLAAALAILLSVAGASLLWKPTPASPAFFSSQDFGLAILVGLLATPLAPIAKDLSTALATAVNTLQLVKKP